MQCCFMGNFDVKKKKKIMQKKRRTKRVLTTVHLQKMFFF